MIMSITSFCMIFNLVIFGTHKQFNGNGSKDCNPDEGGLVPVVPFEAFRWAVYVSIPMAQDPSSRNGLGLSGANELPNDYPIEGA